MFFNELDLPNKQCFGRYVGTVRVTISLSKIFVSYRSRGSINTVHISYAFAGTIINWSGDN